MSMRTCRPGAYMEADRILGSLVLISRKAGDMGREVQDELDSILYTALQQAGTEVHCVAGKLTHGFDQSLFMTADQATRLAQQRGLSKDVVELGERLTIALSQNEAICAPATDSAPQTTAQTQPVASRLATATSRWAR